jgi:hypothetical protein
MRIILGVVLKAQRGNILFLVYNPTQSSTSFSKHMSLFYFIKDTSCLLSVSVFRNNAVQKLQVVGTI